MNNETLKTIISGGVGGIISNTVCHPMDTIKASMMYRYKASYFDGFNMAKVFKLLVQKEGVKGLYRGFDIVIATTVPSTAIYFLALRFVRNSMSDYHVLQDSFYLREFVTGFGAQFLAGFVFTPRDVIKERMQVQLFMTETGEGYGYKSSWDGAKKIFQKEGLFGLYRGFWQTLLLWGMSGGIYVSIYENLKEKWRQSENIKKGHEPAYLILTSSVISIAIAAAVTTPLDVLKLNYQVRNKQDTIFSVTKRLIENHGLKVLFRGLTSRILWMSPRTALSWTSFELTSQYLNTKL
eukprot:TRINITY_DN9129_c0_g1_i1.p1 TRINITY_DN9129_c0_g1~~TRINITY_DN9129_c0_g1_i1.p1  ORF type:complete len:304 (-),score=18.01 TRINITY_DN9129_c0_g1_i1:58-939(-)